MKYIIFLCVFFNQGHIYAQEDEPFECDNNFDDCGTPEQSGGGANAGGGSVLIANTDLGDSYQNADDYDDDGIEDSSDNCPRITNRHQWDSDGDGTGDVCDNCMFVFNRSQSNIDGDELGDFCDEDIDGDLLLNNDDSCPFMYGDYACENSFEYSYDHNIHSPSKGSTFVRTVKEYPDDSYQYPEQNAQSCNSMDVTFSYTFFFILLFVLFAIQIKKTFV